MNNKYLKLLICSIALCLGAALASAQVKEISHDFSSFDTIDADYYFHVDVVKVKKGYSVSMTVDDILLDYVQAYVKGHTLNLTLDKKSLPMDIRKLYKGRNSADPVLNATVYVPEDIKAINLSGSSLLAVDEEIKAKDFEINVEGNAVIRKLSLDAENVQIKLSGKSSADLTVYADHIALDASGSSAVSLEQDSESVEISASGSANISVEGETLDASISASGSSKSALKGKTQTLSIAGSGVSFVDAINLQASECAVKLSGTSKAYETASEKLQIELSGNSTLIYDLEPAVEIVNIKNSTVQRYADVEKK